LENVARIADQIAIAYEHYQVRKAAQLIMELAQSANAYFDIKKPWQAAKLLEKKEEMRATVFCCIQAIKTAALISCPIIPSTANKIWKMLGYSSDLQSQNWQQVLETKVVPGTILPKPEILFIKLEDDQVQKEIEAMHALSKSLQNKKD
jgi:methionyl-tRNA synthetase